MGSVIGGIVIFMLPRRINKLKDFRSDYVSRDFDFHGWAKMKPVEEELIFGW